LAWEVGDDYARRGQDGYVFSRDKGTQGRYMQFEQTYHVSIKKRARRPITLRGASQVDAVGSELVILSLPTEAAINPRDILFFERKTWCM